MKLATLVMAGLATGLLTMTAEAQDRHERRGFWGGFGLGVGSLGCEDCEDRETGFSGHLKLGGTLSPKVLLGFQANGWVKEENDVTLSMSNASAVIYFYPTPTSGFHLTGGLGLSVLDLSIDLGGGTTLSDSETGGGLLLGMGYDARIGRTLSVTPFLNIAVGNFDSGTANFLQLGAGLTWH